MARFTMQRNAVDRLKTSEALLRVHRVELKSVSANLLLIDTIICRPNKHTLGSLGSQSLKVTLTREARD